MRETKEKGSRSRGLEVNRKKKLCFFFLIPADLFSLIDLDAAFATVSTRSPANSRCKAELCSIPNLCPL